MAVPGKGVFASKAVTKYLRSLGIQSYSARKKEVKGYKDEAARPNVFRECTRNLREDMKLIKKPYRIGFFFVRDSRRKFDFINSMQIILDLLVAHDVLDDDDCDNVVPYMLLLDGLWYRVNPSNPGVILYF
jgi:hypothetical protein